MRKHSIVGPSCFHLVGCVIIIYCIWGLTQFKQVLSEEKLSHLVIGKSCDNENTTIQLLEKYAPSPYKDCEQLKENLPRDKWYCFRAKLSNWSIVHLDQCFTELPKDADITKDYTVFTKPFKENPFEICLFVTVILSCMLTIVWAFYMNVPKDTRFKYVAINEGGGPFV